MKATLKKVTAALGVMLVGTILTATAKAECGSLQLPKGKTSIQPQSWRGEAMSGHSRCCWLPSTNQTNRSWGSGK